MHHPNHLVDIEAIRKVLIADADEILRCKDKIHDRTSEFYFLEIMDMCLVFAHLYTLFPQERYKEYVQELLQLCVRSLEQDHLEARLSGGVAGFLWLYYHVQKLGFIDPAHFPSVKEIEHFVVVSMEQDFEAKDYDLLGGFVGKGTAILESATAHRKKKVLTNIVNQLERTAVADATGGLYWIDFDFDNGRKEVCNLGLAHGIPAIIIFLCKVHALGIARRKAGHLIRKSVQWLLDQKTVSGPAAYPPYLGFKGDSRLAWCYGDLCVAFALLEAGTTLGEPRWEQEAIAIASKTTERKLEDSGIALHPSGAFYDISFCHGTSGLAHLYQRLFQATAAHEFAVAAAYWLRFTLSLERSDKFTAGYPFLFYDNKGEDILFLENFSFLNGLPGILLTLSSFLPEQEIPWDTFILTDLAGIRAV